MALPVFSQSVSESTIHKRENRKGMTVKEWNTPAGSKQAFLDHVTTYDSLGRKIEEIASGMTYIELSTQPGYMDEFVAACFLPHTDGSLFSGEMF